MTQGTEKQNSLMIQTDELIQDFIYKLYNINNNTTIMLEISDKVYNTAKGGENIFNNAISKMNTINKSSEEIDASADELSRITMNLLSNVKTFKVE